MSYLCITFGNNGIFIKQNGVNPLKKETMRTLTNIFDFAFFAAEADESLGRSTIVIS